MDSILSGAPMPDEPTADPTPVAGYEPPAMAPTTKKGSTPVDDRVGKRQIRRVVREVLFAGEVAHEPPMLMGHLIADRSPQHRVSGLERIQH
jgi:hypothetical protein